MEPETISPEKLLNKSIRPKLSEAEGKKPYAAFYHRPSAQIPGHVFENLQKCPYPEDQAMHFSKINDLLKPGYLPMEIGYANMSDGSVTVAMHTEMPEATGTMIDWWFWWSHMDSLRYRIIYPEAHFGIRMDEDIDTYIKRKGPYQQRLWGITTYPEEDIGMGKDTLSVRFVSPEAFGFDISKFRKANVATVICGIVGSVRKKLRQHSLMCHFVRRLDHGVEVRSRCWIGGKILLKGLPEGSFLNFVLNTKTIKRFLIPGNIGRKYLMHCAQEYHNLSNILPEMYAEFAR